MDKDVLMKPKSGGEPEKRSFTANTLCIVCEKMIRPDEGESGHSRVMHNYCYGALCLGGQIGMAQMPYHTQAIIPIGVLITCYRHGARIATMLEEGSAVSFKMEHEHELMDEGIREMTLESMMTDNPEGAQRLMDAVRNHSDGGCDDDE